MQLLGQRIGGTSRGNQPRMAQDRGDGRLARPVANGCEGNVGCAGEKGMEMDFEKRTGGGARPPSALSPSALHPGACSTRVECREKAGYWMGGVVGEEELAGHFFSGHAETAIHRRHLPHWEQDGVLCFVTFRLADSLPAGKVEEWQAEQAAWLRRHPRPWSPAEIAEFAELFPRRMERWLDAGHGESLLRSEGARACMDGVLARSEGERCRIHAYVVMPNHVHVLCELRKRGELAGLLHEWKSVSAHALNRLLGRHGKVWQEEYFDRSIRNAEHYRRVVRYIRKNRESVWGEKGAVEQALGGRALGGRAPRPSCGRGEEDGNVKGMGIGLGARMGGGARFPSACRGGMEVGGKNLDTRTGEGARPPSSGQPNVGSSGSGVGGHCEVRR